MPAYAAVPIEDLLPAISTNLELMFPAMSSGRAFTDAELTVFFEHGEARARKGVAIEELLRGWRLGTQALVDEMLGLARQTGVDEGLVLELTRSVLAASDVAVTAAARGHRNAELLSDREEQHRRAQLLRGILLGTLSPSEMRAGVEGYGLDPDRQYRAVRARPTQNMPADRLERLLGAAPGGHDPRGVTALIDRDLCGFVDRPPPETTDAAIGLGPVTSLDGLESSFRQASRAALTAAAFGLRGVYDLGRLGLLPAVVADDDVGDQMVRRYIDPLGDTGAGRDVLATVRHYLDGGMRVDTTASALFVHENTVRYRLRRFEQSTGADLRDPPSALEVWWGLQRSRLTEPPT